MSTLRVATIEPEGATTSLTLGASGDTVTSSADSIKANTFKDAGGNTLWTSNGAGVLSSVNAGLKPTTGLKLLARTVTSGTPSSVNFTSGIDSTYDEYFFIYTLVKFDAVNAYFTFQCSTDGGSNYNTSLTSAYFHRENANSGGGGGVGGVIGGQCQASGTAYQVLSYNFSNYQTRGGGGFLHLYNPSSTTYYKPFYAETVGGSGAPGLYSSYCPGVFQTTSAINAISFKVASGTMYNGGVFEMYGVS